jgi:hypothetical protein
MKKENYYLDRFFKRQRAPEKDVAPPPDKGAARFFFLLTTHLTKLFLLNLLFILFCLPVITIPAALNGMNRVCMLLVREGVCYIWADFYTEFKASLLKSIPIFLPGATLIVSAFLCFLSSQNRGGSSFILVAFSVLFFIAGLLMNCYAFAMLSLCKLRNRDILRNAVSLIFLEPKADLLLVCFVGVIAITFVWFLPYTLPLALIIFALLSLISTNVINEPLNRRIITKI